MQSAAEVLGGVMGNPDPLEQSKEQHAQLIERISCADSPVGIDPAFTHAVIIQYLRNIEGRLERLEAALAERKTLS